MGLSLPEFIPLTEAATRHNINPQVLDQAVSDGAVHVVKVGEDLLVKDEDVSVIAVQLRKVDPGEDELVSISEVARRLNLSPGTVSQWQELGWLPMLATGPNRVKLVSWTRAKALDELRQARGRRRLIPRSRDFGRRAVKQ
ncbi:MAG: hypothetical protein RBT75_11830 [Anaerolineae bacterium]|jgi:hypothetical protein|nr:hypothetical protein [Anaerolineae bacterium]